MRTSGKSSRGTRFLLGVECLEDRTVPAGNVTVSVLDHVLYVNGDDAANKIAVFGFGKNSAIIRSLDGTTINGQAGPLFLDSVKHGFCINMGAGDDVLAIANTQFKGDLTVFTTDGNDAVSVINARHRGATDIRTGNDNDTLFILNSVFRDSLRLETGAGNDQVVFDQARGKGLFAFNVQGTDFFSHTRSGFDAVQLIGFLPGLSGMAGTNADLGPPTVALTSNTPQAIRSGTIDFTATFSEDVFGFSAGGISVTNGTVTSFTQVDARTYQFSVSAAGEGTVTTQVRANAAIDAALNFNLASDSVSRVFDTIAPSVTANDLVTNDTTPALTGTVSESNATVVVKIFGQTTTQTVTATVTGNTWTATVPTALAQGNYTARATATDPAGNSTTSAAANIVIDTTAPAIPTMDLTAGTDSGPDGDLRTELATVTLSGMAEAGATVTIARNPVPGSPGTGAVVATTTASANGMYTVNVPLDVGPNSLAVRVTDAAGNSSVFSQTFTRNTPPTAGTVPTQNLTAGTQSAPIDLLTVFNDTERVVRLMVSYPSGMAGTTNANIDINLFTDDALANVNNFLAYVNDQDAGEGYDNTIFHRLATNFVLQGGGFQFNDAANTFPAVTDKPAVVNEPGISNTRGTLAFAKLPAFTDLNGNGSQDPGEPTNPNGGPNSATNEFFFNLADNSGNLDAQNGGFTVFGQVMNGGLSVIDNINTVVSTFSGAGIPGAPPFPIRQGANTTNFPANVTAADMIQLLSADELTLAQRLSFTLVGTGGSDNPAVATATLNGTSLTINALTPGTATITVRATDLDGSVTDLMITVNVMA